MKNPIQKSALALGFAGLLAVAAFTLAIAVPTPAEARVVCREGWRWDNTRCVEIRGHDRHGYYRHHAPRYVVGGYLPRYVSYRPLPRDYSHRYRRAPRGYSYVMVGDDVLLLDRRGRIVRIYD